MYKMYVFYKYISIVIKQFLTLEYFIYIYIYKLYLFKQILFSLQLKCICIFLNILHIY